MASSSLHQSGSHMGKTGSRFRMAKRSCRWSHGPAHMTIHLDLVGKSVVPLPSLFRSPPKATKRKQNLLSYGIFLFPIDLIVEQRHFCGFSLKGLRPLSSLPESGEWHPQGERERPFGHFSRSPPLSISDDYMF